MNVSLRSSPRKGRADWGEPPEPSQLGKVVRKEDGSNFMEAQPTFFRLEFGDTFSPSLLPAFRRGKRGSRREDAEATRRQAICLYGGKRDTARHTNLVLFLPFLPLRLPTQLCFESFLLFDTWRQPEGVNNIWDSDKKEGGGKWQLYGFTRWSNRLQEKDDI